MGDNIHLVYTLMVGVSISVIANKKLKSDKMLVGMRHLHQQWNV